MFEILFFSLNFVFYAMEMRYKMTGELVMNVGELTPVELETTFALVLVI